MTEKETAEQWVPHHKETWPWRIGKLKKTVQMQAWLGHGHNPEFIYYDLPAGTKVKIVMVSRFGDVGITDNISADIGYGARVLLEDLERCDA